MSEKYIIKMIKKIEKTKLLHEIMSSVSESNFS